MSFKNYFYVCMILMICTSTLFGQNQGFNYQAVARDATGAIRANQTVNLRFKIKEGGTSGNVAYEETHQGVMTNDFGLVNLVIGGGSPQLGNFANINWAGNTYFLTVELNGAEISTTELLSVPYSKVASVANQMNIDDLLNVNAPTASNGQVLKWDGTHWVPDTDNSGDSYQAGAGISISGNTIANTSPDQTVTLNGNGATSVSGSYPNFTISSTDNVNDADSNPTNEIQSLSLSGNTLSLSGSNSVALPNNSPWTQSGSNVYRNTGNIGIGTASPTNKLHLMGSTGNLFRIEHSASGPNLDLIELQVSSTFTGQFLEFQQGSSIVGRVNADGSAEFENVTVQEELSNSQAPVTGRVYADILPLAYGYIGSGGSMITEFGVTTVSNFAPGQYLITLDKSWSGFPVIIGNAHDFTPTNEVFTAYPVGNNLVQVNITPGDTPFYFVVYGNPQ